MLSGLITACCRARLHMEKSPPVHVRAAGELFGVSYDFTQMPHAHYTVIGAGGDIRVDMPLSLRRPVLMHDSALTEDFFVFVETPLVYAPEVMQGKKANLARAFPLPLSGHVI